MMKRQKILLLATCLIISNPIWGVEIGFKFNDEKFKEVSGNRDREQYIKETNKHYKDARSAYEKKIKALDAYFSTKSPKSEARTLWDAIRGVESYRHDIKNHQQHDNVFTRMLSAKVAGVEDKYNGHNMGSQHGINVNRTLSKQGREAFILAAIHAAYNSIDTYNPDGSYDSVDDSVDDNRKLIKVTTADCSYDVIPVKMNKEDWKSHKDKINTHRVAYQFFKNLTVNLEMKFNQETHYGQDLTSNEFKRRQWPRIFTPDQITEDLYKNTVDSVIKSLPNYARDLLTKGKFSPLDGNDNKVSFEKLAKSYYEDYKILFAGALNENNDRTWGIIREEEVKEEAPHFIKEIKEEDIFVGDKLVKDKIEFEISGDNQVTFTNIGGATVYQDKKRTHAKQETARLEFQTFDMMDVTKRKKLFALIMKKGLSVDEAKKIEDSVKGRFVFSTLTPETDGIFEILEENGKTICKMIAKPLNGDVLKSIAKTSPEKFKDFVKKLMSHKGNEAEKPKEGQNQYAIQSADIKGIDEAKLIDPSSKQSRVTLKGFLNRTVLHAKADGNQYLWVRVDDNKDNDKVLEISSEISIDGRKAEDLYKEGVFLEYDQTLFYIKKGIGKNAKTQVYALNAAAKELVKDKENSNKILNEKLELILKERKKD